MRLIALISDEGGASALFRCSGTSQLLPVPYKPNFDH
jgi:hypothetical protein